MTTVQRIIKYCALAFALFIIVSIFYSIGFGLSIISEVVGPEKSYEEEVIENVKDIEIKQASFQNLTINIDHANFIVKTGKSLKVESNSSNIKVKEEGQKLTIKEKNKNWFGRTKTSSVILTIPEDTIFDNVKIDTGAGKIEIESITTRKLDFELGAGSTKIKELNVLNEADIEGGAGKIEILSGSIHDLDLDIGVGKFVLYSTLTGNTKVDAGVGEANIVVLNAFENYRVQLEKGIGTVKLQGDSVSDGIYGTGMNFIDIDGGVGSFSIDFKSEI